MPTTLEKLHALAEAHEHKALGLRLAIAELTDDRTEKKQARGIDAMLEKASALRAVASNGHTNGHAPPRSGTRWTPERHAKFRRSMKKVWAKKKAAAPTTHHAPTPKKTRARPAATAAETKRATRLESARLLAAFHATEPRTLAAAGLNHTERRKIGPLIRHGYLRPGKGKGAGVVRTSKEFAP